MAKNFIISRAASHAKTGRDLSLGKFADIVAVPVPMHVGVAAMPYDITTRSWPMSVEIAGPVSVVGYPFGKDASGTAIWATGFIASEPCLDFEELPVFQIDCRTRPGQSGSPVIISSVGGYKPGGGGMVVRPNQSFVKLLGLYSGRIHGESDLGMVWKIDALRVVATLRRPGS